MNHLAPLATPSKYPSKNALSFGAVLGVGVGAGVGFSLLWPTIRPSAIALLISFNFKTGGLGKSEDVPSGCESGPTVFLSLANAASACCCGVGVGVSGLMMLLKSIVGSIALAGTAEGGEMMGDGEGWVKRESRDLL